MSRSKGFAVRPGLLAGLLIAAVTMPALAQQSAGLGQPFPADTPNVSVVPDWRVYVYVSNGVKYIQINDVAGKVHAVVATANGQFLIMPMGLDASRVSTSQQKSAALIATEKAAVKVYDDGQVRITATTADDNQTFFTASCGGQVGCSHGGE